MTRHYCENFPYTTPTHPRITHDEFQPFCELVFFNFPDKVVIIMSEHPENQGMSVTNASEYIATQILNNPELMRQFPHLTRHNVQFVEHYSQAARGAGYMATWDVVSYEWNEERQEFYNPSWRPCSLNELKELTGNQLP